MKKKNPYTRCRISFDITFSIRFIIAVVTWECIIRVHSLQWKYMSKFVYAKWVCVYIVCCKGLWVHWDKTLQETHASFLIKTDTPVGWRIEGKHQFRFSLKKRKKKIHFETRRWRKWLVSDLQVIQSEQDVKSVQFYHLFLCKCLFSSSYCCLIVLTKWL